MDKTNVQLAVLGVSLFVLVVVMAWHFTGGEARVPTPDELATVALSTAPEEEREKATLSLTRHPEQPITHIRRVFDQTDSFRVKVATMRGMGKLRDWESGPKLIELLRSDSEYMRSHAAGTLNQIAVEDFGFRARDPERKRLKSIQIIEEKWPLLHEGYQAKANVEKIRAEFERKQKELEGKS